MVAAYALLVAACGGLLSGLAIELLGLPFDPRWAWGGATVAVLLPSGYATARAWITRKSSADLIAALSLAGALALDQTLTGAVIAVMLTGGGALESYARGRARRDLSALLAHAPTIAHRREGAGLRDCALEDVRIGDVLVIKPGEVLPADGVLISAGATLDESSLTGEARPSEKERAAPLRSGTLNAGPSFELRVDAKPADSTYAALVKLVAQAGRNKAPLVRMADRYARLFLVITLFACGVAYALSADPARALAVLVVATPCPLIIAAPVAIVAGISRAARRGILIKDGSALEALSAASVVLLDKTGTVTSATPEMSRVESFAAYTPEQVLRAAATVEQASTHAFAPAIVREAKRRGLVLPAPEDIAERAGLGVQGRMGDMQVALGQLAWVAPTESRSAAVHAVLKQLETESADAVFVAIDGQLAGALILHNPIRTEAPRVIESLRRNGIRAVHMVTGDRLDVAELVGDAVGVDRVFAERSPIDKAELVMVMRAQGKTVLVGDGINDAPALARADVGVAMGARGANVASEAADIVLARDKLDSLREGYLLARRTVRIARESVLVGMALSTLAMAFAAAGMLPPLAGALLQEGIDVLAILNALRALLPERARGSATLEQVVHGTREEHASLRAAVDALATLATQLESLPAQEALAMLHAVEQRLQGELLPHELREQEHAYPALRRLLAPEDPTGPLIHTHHEIMRRARLLSRLVARLPASGPERDDLPDLRRALYGLHAVLALHFAQEEELYAACESG